MEYKSVKEEVVVDCTRCSSNLGYNLENVNELSSDGELIGSSGNFFIGDLVVCSGIVVIGV